jgi:hypothetical protein
VLGYGLLVEAVDPFAVVAEAGDSERQPRSHDRHRRHRAGLVVMLDQRAEVDVGDRVGVGKTEAVARQQVSGPMQTAARRGVLAGVDAADPHIGRPRGLGGERCDPVAPVAGQQQEV